MNKVALFLLFGIFSCNRNATIEGSVVDSYGQPLDGVEVKVMKSTFSDFTKNGRYKLGFVPGEFQISYQLDGFTDYIMDLNIQQPTVFPVENIQLFPIPASEGLYHLGRTGVKEISPSKLNFKNKSYFCEGHGPTVNQNEAKFIDTKSSIIMPARLEKGGLIFEEGKNGYNGIFKDEKEKFGNTKQVLVRLFDPKPGEYAWIQFKKTQNDIIINKSAQCYPFTISNENYVITENSTEESLNSEQNELSLLVFTQSNNCSWNLEDVTGKSTQFFESKKCPEELFWNENTVYFQDNSGFYSVDIHSKKVNKIQRPTDPVCPADENWLTSRISSDGAIHWACWAEAERDKTLPSGKVQSCIGQFCVENDLTGLAISTIVKDFVYMDNEWELFKAYGDCYGTEGCYQTVEFVFNQEKLPKEMHSITNNLEYQDIPDKIYKNTALIEALGAVSGRAFGDGYLLNQSMEEFPGMYGPIIISDSNGNIKGVFRENSMGTISIEINSDWAILKSGGEWEGTNSKIILINYSNPKIVRTWESNKKVVLLPTDTPPPFGPLK